jgi:hypothetical protein
VSERIDVLLAVAELAARRELDRWELADAPNRHLAWIRHDLIRAVDARREPWLVVEAEDHIALAAALGLGVRA